MACQFFGASGCRVSVGVGDVCASVGCASFNWMGIGLVEGSLDDGLTTNPIPMGN